MNSYAVICCKTGIPGMIKIGPKGKTTLLVGNDKCQGEIETPLRSNNNKIFFTYATERHWFRLQVVKMTTISPLKHRGSEAAHLRLFNQL